MREFAVVIVDDKGLDLGLLKRRFHDRREFAIHNDDLCFCVIELEGDDRGVEARVDGMQNCACHRHTEVAVQHGRRVGEHDRNGISNPNAMLAEG